MADLKISQLPAGSVPAGANIFPVVQSGTTNQVTITQLYTAPSISSPTITGHATIEGVTATGATGTGAFVFATSPTLVTPVLGTPASGTLTNCTIPVGGVSGLGTGVATALAVNVGSAGAPVVNGGALGTPASGTLTNCTLPVAGVSGLGTGVATFLATPSSANLASAVTDETGTGALVFATGPTLSAPDLTLKSYAFGTLAAGNTGEVAYITGVVAALAWGDSISGATSGSTSYLAWYNGSAWTVIGK